MSVFMTRSWPPLKSLKLFLRTAHAPTAVEWRLPSRSLSPAATANTHTTTYLVWAQVLDPAQTTEEIKKNQARAWWPLHAPFER